MCSTEPSLRDVVNRFHARRRPVTRVRDEILASWRRAVSSGLRPDRFDVPYDADLDAGERLARAARPVIERLAEDLAGTCTSIIVTDERAHVITRVVSDAALAARLDRIHLAPGFYYDEDHTGTNGIGTALATHKPTFVHAEEHYADSLTGMACAATPINDLRKGVAVGVVDLTCFAEDANPLMLPFSRRVAWEIEQSLLAGYATHPGAGHRSTRSTPGWRALTDTERTVAELIAQGMTNREAASRLYMSRHTVDAHLRHIFRKLGITSRVELARMTAGGMDHTGDRATRA